MKNEMTILENSAMTPVVENEVVATDVTMDEVDTVELRTDKLRNNDSYKDVNEAIDYLGKVGTRAVRLQETIESSAVANHEQAFKDSKTISVKEVKDANPTLTTDPVVPETQDAPAEQKEGE